MNAPTFPTNPAIGQWWQNWVWNGVRWVCSGSNGIRVIITTFPLGASPYQPSPGLVTAVVECLGGGGGAGGVSLIGSDLGWILSGSGGGSGTYARIALDAALVLGGVIVTVGDGGVGGNPTGGIPGFGAQGGATTFGALCGAPGGGGGGDSTFDGTNATFGAPGIGGGGTGGEVGGKVVYHGEDGLPGPAIHYLTAAPDHNRSAGGNGGTMFGGATSVVAGHNTVVAGSPAHDKTGAGGTGAASNLAVGSQPGGKGGSGTCVVTEYCFADMADDGCDGTMNVNARVAVDREWQGRPGRGEGFEGQEFADD